MSFTAPKFTNAGRQLQTRVIAGDTLTFTVIKLGDGTMTTEPIAALTDLIHGIITLPVHEVRRNADYAEVTGVFQNAGLSSGFYWREIGIFAADPDYPNDRSHDILYCYQNAAELAEYIPSASSAVIEKIIRVACVVGDAENVTVGLASQAYVKAEDLQALEEQHSKDVERIDNALDAVDPTKITAKAAPADGDGVMIADSADGGKAKRLLWSSVKAALGKLFVPLARKINGKALSADVTLTGDDIAMGADDAETLRAAMAKRLGSRAKYLAGTSIFDYMKSEYNAGHHAGFIHAINCPDIPNDEKDWGYNVFFFHGEYYVAYALRSYPSIPDVGYVRFADSNGWVADWQKIVSANIPEVHNFPLANGFTGDLIYYKTQENICTVSGCIYGTFAKDSYISIGYLPEGFHSAHTLELPVTASYGVGVRCSVSTDGNVVVIISTSGVAYVYLNISFPCA